jgi:hypothetical protein
MRRLLVAVRLRKFDVYLCLSGVCVIGMVLMVVVVDRGWCGTTADHCAADNGCQAGFGNCTGTRNVRDLFSKVLF